MVSLRDDPELARRNRFSAGSLSLGFHLIAFLLLAFFVRPSTPTDKAGDELDRSVEIVLTRAKPHDTDRYLEAAEATGSREGVSNDASHLPAPAVQADSLIPHELALPTNNVNVEAGNLASAEVRGSSQATASIPVAGDVAGFVAAEQARLDAARPRGNPVSVSLFGGGSSAGRSFIFVIDRSKSMGSEGLGALLAAEQELLRVIEPLQPEHQFQVIAYHHQCVYLSKRQLLPATTENKSLVGGFLSGLAAFGATEHEMALLSALYHKPDVLYLLTDGGDPELSISQLQKITRQAGGQTQIHCVQFGFGARQSDQNFLNQLATMNAGTFTYVDMSAKSQR